MTDAARIRNHCRPSAGVGVCALTRRTESARNVPWLSTDPDKGMAGRCVQGLMDVLEGNYGGDITKMPYVVNKEAFGK